MRDELRQMWESTRGLTTDQRLIWSLSAAMEIACLSIGEWELVNGRLHHPKDKANRDAHIAELAMASWAHLPDKAETTSTLDTGVPEI